MNALTRALQALLGTQERLSYRRLLAWVTTCAFLCTDQVSEPVWLTVTIVFIGGQVVEKVWGKNGSGTVLPAAPAMPADPGAGA